MNMKRIKDTRIDKDYKQKYMAEKLNIPRSTYSSWENGYGQIPLLYFIYSCLILNISLDYALGLSDNPKRYYNITKLDLEVISQNLLVLLKENNLSQKELSIILNYSKSMISKIMHGKTPISTKSIYTLAKKYNFSIDEFCYKKMD